MSLRASIYPKLLTSFLHLKEFSYATAERCTDEAVEQWIKKQVKVRDKFTSSKDIATAVRNAARFETGLINSKRWVMQLFVDFCELMEECSWESRFQIKTKECADTMYSLLQPTALRSQLAAALESDVDSLQTD